MEYWKCAVVIGAIGVIFFLAAAFTPLANALNAQLSIDATGDHADAIVVLGGSGVRGDGTLSDTSVRRTLNGIALHRTGRAGLLVLSGSGSGGGRLEADLRRALAHDCGIPASAIWTHATGRTTREEAHQIGLLLQSNGLRSVILVADVQGMRRAMRLFEKSGLVVVPAPTADVSSRVGHPESQLHLARRAVIESVAWVYYWLAGYL